MTCCFAEAGFETFGFDVDRSKVEQLRAGRSYIGHIPAERIARLVKSRRLQPTTDFSALRDCDAAIICVPTPLGEGRIPDLTYVVNTAEMVAENLHRGQLVVLESTTYPGTTDEVLLPLFARSGLKLGEDFFLAFSPEREDPANTDYSTRTIPKVVGGVTPNCGKVAVAAYSALVERVVPVSSARAAEASKLLENIYRCVNIAMINELKLLFERMGIDVWEVIKASATKPFGFTPFYPGPGLGGHCIPVDPFYLTWKAKQYDFNTRFIELAGEINSGMPQHVVNRLTEGLNLLGKPLNGAEILLIGAAYKKNVEDVRESPAIRVIQLLHERLANVSYYDPYVPRLETRYLEKQLTSVRLCPEVVSSCDAVIVVTDHSNIDYAMILDHAKLVVDTRNATASYRKPSHKVIMA
ncbi:MAG TPA: nucleotide sugar dehydrogenase [Candidatus Binataceae bacterium]|jgi:UDP-N-acetyl-D-glucosamine dehydrogenase|nr:nucleotide sugar dehydrogenase [Candidatus Binataceae bacterium]